MTVNRSRQRNAAIRRIAIHVLLSCGWSATLRAQAPPDVTAEEWRVAADLSFLTSPILHGRTVGSAGAAVAAQYLAAALQSAGLEPFAGDGSYLQKTAVRRAGTTGSIVIGFGPRTVALRVDQEVYVAGRAGRVTVDGELVFVGYGVTAPGAGWDDLRSVVLDGKVVLALDGDPGLAGSPRFRGDTQTVHGIPRQKLEAFARLGAVGAILVHDPATSVSLETRVALDPTAVGTVEVPQGLAFVAWIDRRTLTDLLASGNRNLDVMIRRAAQPGFIPIPVGAHAVTDLSTHFEIVEAVTVAARIPGTTAPEAGFVLLVSHYDEHGAVTNAGGHNAGMLAALLATARRVSGGAPIRGRPVVVVATPGGHVAGLRQSFARSAHSAVILDYMGAPRPPEPATWGQWESSLGSSLNPLLDSLALPHPAPRYGFDMAPEFTGLAVQGVTSLAITGSGSLRSARDESLDELSRAVAATANLAAAAVLRLSGSVERPTFLPSSLFPAASGATPRP